MTVAGGLPIKDVETWSTVDFGMSGLESLLPEQWLNNDPIDLFAVLDCETSEKVSYIPAHRYTSYKQEIALGNTHPDLYPNSPTHANQMIAHPIWISIINHNNNHWQLLCIINHGTPHCMALILDSLAPSSNLKCVEGFVSLYIQTVYNKANQPLHGNTNPAPRQCSVQQQPNGHDCGTFALLNLKNVIYGLDDLLALRPTTQAELFDFCWWYQQLAAVHYRSYLFQRFEELLATYS
jgi:hypothetical protein